MGHPAHTHNYAPYGAHQKKQISGNILGGRYRGSIYKNIKNSQWLCRAFGFAAMIVSKFLWVWLTDILKQSYQRGASHHSTQPLAKNSRSFVAQKQKLRARKVLKHLYSIEVRRCLFLATKERWFFLKEDFSSQYESDGMVLVWSLKACFYKSKAKP